MIMLDVVHVFFVFSGKEI